jgi:hypothetical protein
MKYYNDNKPDMQAAIARTLHMSMNVKGTVEDCQRALQKLNPQLSEYPEYPDFIVRQVEAEIDTIVASKNK